MSAEACRRTPSFSLPTSGSGSKFLSSVTSTLPAHPAVLLTMAISTRALTSTAYSVAFPSRIS